MDNLKTLMGNAYHENLTIEEVDAFLTGKKLADLSSGSYVAKDKFSKIEAELKELREATKDYEEVKKQVETYQTKEKETTLKQALVEAGIKDEFIDYIAFKVEKGEIANDDKLVNNVKTYIKDKPQFAKVAEADKPVVKKTIETSIGNGNDKPKTDNKAINDALRSAVKRVDIPQK